MADRPPRVFISYSHDTPDHKKWVAMLGTRLRERGVDAVLDQWDLRPGKDVAVFMEEQLGACDYALLICSDRYVEKANSGQGGVGYEKMIVSGAMIKNMDAGKFIPIIRSAGEAKVPTFIETKLYLDFSEDEFFETVFDDLLRTLLGAEIGAKPPLGEMHDFTTSNESEAPKRDIRKESGLSIEAYEVFEQFVIDYDKGKKEKWTREDIKKRHKFGKLTLEMLIAELKERELIKSKIQTYVYSGASTRRPETFYSLTPKGKSFARELGLV